MRATDHTRLFNPRAVAPATAPLIEVVDVSKYFGNLAALQQISFSIDTDRVVGLIGPNGAGKTTMIAILSGAAKPSEGDVRYCGRSIVKLPPHRIGALGITRTFQLVQPFSHLTVRECTMLGALFGAAEGRRAKVSQAADYADDILQFLGLYSKADVPAETLNVPERKRLEIARALAARPRLLLLDEVMAGLNATEVEEVIGLIRSIRDSGMTIIVIEHVMQAIIGLSDRIIVLHHGQKIADGPVSDILNDENVIKIYMGSGLR